MEILPGYGRPPWVFKGRALYQIHLVKASTARGLIPKNFRLVEAFGYTLGGFFLANYNDSPGGIFDELVVLAGLLWSKSSSCAWASRVLVSNDEACLHGREVVGLPSHVARFSKITEAAPTQRESIKNSLVDLLGLGSTLCTPQIHTAVHVSELMAPSAVEFCTIRYLANVFTSKFGNDFGVPIKISLPSFSGRTKYNPNLLRYCCEIECRVRAVKAAEVSARRFGAEKIECGGRDGSICVMLSKPLLALELSCMKMLVGAPHRL